MTVEREHRLDDHLEALNRDRRPAPEPDAELRQLVMAARLLKQLSPRRSGRGWLVIAAAAAVFLLALTALHRDVGGLGPVLALERAAAELGREYFHAAFPGLEGIVDRELNVMRVPFADEGPPVYLAWLTVDRLNGLAVILTRHPGGEYRAAYELREPVQEVRFDVRSRSLVLAAGTGGTGLQTNWYRVLRLVEGRPAEVWAGVQYACLTGPGPAVSERFGGIFLAHGGEGWELRHVLSRHQGFVAAAVDHYVYDEEQRRFLPGGPVLGAGRHLILDRTYVPPGPAVRVLLLDLEPAACGRMRLALLGGDGRILAEATAQPGTDNWLFIPAGLEPGDYHVALLRREEGTEEEIDRARLRVIAPVPAPGR